MSTRKRLVRALITLAGLGAVFGAVPASAPAFLHVQNAADYAEEHVWDHQCGSPNRCTRYPAWTGWYSRSSDSQVRVNIRRYGNGWSSCTRIYGVGGSDASPYINSNTSNPYWVCPAASVSARDLILRL